MVLEADSLILFNRECLTPHIRAMILLRVASHATCHVAPSGTAPAASETKSVGTYIHAADDRRVQSRLLLLMEHSRLPCPCASTLVGAFSAAMSMCIDTCAVSECSPLLACACACIRIHVHMHPSSAANLTSTRITCVDSRRACHVCVTVDSNLQVTSIVVLILCH